jgi:putative transposase
MGSLRRFSPTAVLSAFCAFVAASLRSQAALQIEILALRHQLNVLQHSVKRPRLSAVDRSLWVHLSRNWPAWRAALKFLKPATVIGWHYKGFRLFWTWKCRHGRPGRPAVSQEIRQLIRRMSRENPLWGALKKSTETRPCR